MQQQSTISYAIVAALETANLHEKVHATRNIVATCQANHYAKLGRTPPPDRPARSAKPSLLPLRGVPRRRITAGNAGRVALLHAIAQIELNAIDRALDMAS